MIGISRALSLINLQRVAADDCLTINLQNLLAYPADVQFRVMDKASGQPLSGDASGVRGEPGDTR
ncbi:hypothetical protein [Pseudomonas sp. UW4]|uniref:hypothetical protein n=1 Tax=Pseudomonas sp. UW4 TaxID=1207075 RepID=UPI0002E3E0EC|nr:hypothetical protein [Pseudomonas sp. UW4]